MHNFGHFMTHPPTYKSVNTQYKRNPDIGLKMMVKIVLEKKHFLNSSMRKAFLRPIDLLHNKNGLFCAWRDFKKITCAIHDFAK